MVLLACIAALQLTAGNGIAVATEVFKWTDANGVVHYGDRPPDGQKAQLVNVWGAPRSTRTQAAPEPGSAQAGTASDAMTADSSKGQESAPTQSLADVQREKMARNRKEQRETQAEMDRMCATHRQRLESVEPNRRVFYTDENGESVRMDDDKRIALVDESRDFIEKNCD